MLAIAFTFPAGRYHATPWGRHVNEADVAWPPDLWRITRALIATWHRKLDHERFPAARLSGLLEALAQAPPPAFRLPEVAIHTHTRHYMPGKGDKKTLVFDAFARVRDDDPVEVIWPSLELDQEQLELLDTLLENLGYLGRAESWVDASRSLRPQKPNCLPAVDSVDPETGEVKGDIVSLLAPIPRADYERFRLEALAADRRRLKPAQVRTLKATLPEDWVAAISVDTAELQAAKWNRPPSARTLSYLRLINALRATAPRIARRPTRVLQPESTTTARFAMYGKPLPRIEDALRIGEAVRLAAMGCARRVLNGGPLPPELSGHELPADNRHGHAFWLPEDADNDGFIDHLLVHAPAGLGRDACRVLTSLSVLRRRDGEPLRLMLEGLGQVQAFSRTSRLLGTAQRWRSVTPWLRPWHLSKAESRDPAAVQVAIETQIRREWMARGAPVAIERIQAVGSVRAGGRTLRPLHFHRFRGKRGLSQPDTLGQFVEIQFEHSLKGPIALGFGCHFGLGLFRPSPDALQ